MGDEVSKSQSNSLNSDSESFSNSAGRKGKLEEINFLKENEDTIINRVWVVKKSISLTDGHVDAPYLNFLPSHEKYFNDFKLCQPKHNVFKLKNEFNTHFKHWALILELSNCSYVNIQFSITGFSLKEFNATNIPGESALNAILETWGEDGHPFSFCFLGYANYRYEDLKRILLIQKNIETKKFNKNGRTYYNVLFYNCQDFVCNLEYILFGFITPFHLFDFYIEKFFKHFFPNIDLNILKQKYETDLNKINSELYEANMKEIQKKSIAIEKEITEQSQKILYRDNLKCAWKRIREIFL